MPKGKDDIIRHHNLNKSFSEVINRSILFKTCLLSMRRYPFYQIMIFFSYKWSSCSRGGGGGGGVEQVLNLWNTSDLVPRGWWVPFTVIELVPRVVILQIIGQ